MEIIIGIVSAFLAVIPIAYFLYTHYVRKAHSIRFDVGNVAVVRVASPHESRNARPALLIYSLAFVNEAPDALTMREVNLTFRFQGAKRQATLLNIPTGKIDGVETVALANSRDNILIGGWKNLREALTENTMLQPGGVLKASAAFLLDVPLDRVNEISHYTIAIHGYSGRSSKHKLVPQSNWYDLSKRGFSLVDAPVIKTQDKIHWEGITVTSESRP